MLKALLDHRKREEEWAVGNVDVQGDAVVLVVGRDAVLGKRAFPARERDAVVGEAAGCGGELLFGHGHLDHGDECTAELRISAASFSDKRRG